MTQQETKPNHVGFEVLAAEVMKITMLISCSAYSTLKMEAMFLRNVG
jgi:hypothetical protein